MGPDDVIVNLAGVLVSIDSPNSSRWDSGWKAFARTLYPEEKKTALDFSMKRDEFMRLQSPVNLRISVA
jgi:hypothetical protein